MHPIKLAIVGVGKIVYDQHIPAISSDADFTLLASASRNNFIPDIPSFASIDEMLEKMPEIEAVSLCMPPQYRHPAAYRALQAGKHVFLEKPPGATLSEVADLHALADSKGLTLFASWHSRYAPAVQVIKAHLAQHQPRKVNVIWKEDVRKWHPGQDWIWQAGGLGVFDPGINALSIVTEILPSNIFLQAATLDFPENRDAPVAANLDFKDADGLQVRAEFDWLQTGKQSWDIVIETSQGEVRMTDGGGKLWINGEPQQLPAEGEYPALYRRFASLVRGAESDVDLAPLRHVADAFMLGKRRQVAAFFD